MKSIYFSVVAFVVSQLMCDWAVAQTPQAPQKVNVCELVSDLNQKSRAQSPQQWVAGPSAGATALGGLFSSCCGGRNGWEAGDAAADAEEAVALTESAAAGVGGTVAAGGAVWVCVGVVTVGVAAGVGAGVYYVYKKQAGNNPEAGYVDIYVNDIFQTGNYTATIGDKIEIRVTSLNPISPPQLLGAAKTWIARSAGETKYFCSPSIKPGEFKPWIGYDSQVHGSYIAQYPKGYQPREDDWVYTTPSSYSNILSDHNFSQYSFTWYAQRAMDRTIKKYDPVITWDQTKKVDNVINTRAEVLLRHSETASAMV